MVGNAGFGPNVSRMVKRQTEAVNQAHANYNVSRNAVFLFNFSCKQISFSLMNLNGTKIRFKMSSNLNLDCTSFFSSWS